VLGAVLVQEVADALVLHSAVGEADVLPAVTRLRRAGVGLGHAACVRL